MLVEEKKNNNFLVVVTSDEIKSLKVKHINFLFPVKEFCVGFLHEYTIEEVDIPKSYLFINRVLDNQAIESLKQVLSNVNQNIKGLCFTDLGVINLVKSLGLHLELIYMQSHNTTNTLSINYYLEYVDSLLISTDITKEEIMKILDYTHKPLVVPYFTLMDVMYSRRTLLKNFADAFQLNRVNPSILTENGSKKEFFALENPYGTVFYNKKFIDYREIHHNNILYYYINPLGLDKTMVEHIIAGKDMSEISDTGFLYQSTYYNLKTRM